MKRMLFCAALSFAALISPAHAVGNLTDITIYDRHENRLLPVHQHDGKYYVAGKPGNEYQIRICNQTGTDYLAVTSVDGVNVLSGETAAWDQRGYIFTGYDSYDIMGWRKSSDHVASFYFTQLPDSYAARTGRPDNVGVIGVALFRRKYEAPPISYSAPPVWSHPSLPSRREESNSADAPAVITQSAPAAKSAETAPGAQGRIAEAPVMKDKSLGTGHGRTVDSSVRIVSFERASYAPDEIITIHYDSRRNLLARGVIPSEPLAANPFPRSDYRDGFVLDPPRRR
jgi:hypothetical protein